MSPALILNNTSIRTDDDGRYCLNDLHRAAVASGANERTKEPGKFFASPQTTELVAELETTQDLGSLPVSKIEGRNGGTYVCKELVYAYAMWISPAFHLKVIRAYDALVTQPPAPQPINPAQLSRMQLIEIAMEAERERLVLVEKVEQMLPKAEGFDRIAGTEGSLCLRDSAKELQMRPKDLNAWLQAHRWIYRRPGGSNFIGYQDRIQSGLLEHKAHIVVDGAGNERIRDQVRITAKGLARLATALGEDIHAGDSSEAA